MSMMYCPTCESNVDISKWTGARIAILIILLILGIILGIIYLIYVATLTEKCPRCGTPAMAMQPPKFNNPPSAGANNNRSSSPGTVSTTSNTVYCSQCGQANSVDSKFCANCGAEIKKD